jgi:hypothetical protein
MQGRPFVRNGITLLSGVDPVRLARRTADAVPLSDRTLYFCPSPLYGHGLDLLLERLEKEAPNSAVLCVEADGELFALSLENSVPSLAPEKLRITDIRESEKLCAFVREAWGARAFRRVETVRFTGGWQLSPQLYDSLCEALRGQIAVDWGNAMTLAKLGRLYIRNALQNLPLSASFPSISELSFGTAPVLVLGAGPSLDETLDALSCHFLHGLERESRPFKIVCVDTCLGALKDRGIVPDLAVVLESQHWNLRDFIGCRGWDVPVAVDLSALPESARMLKGGFLFMTPWTPLNIFERLKDEGLLPAEIAPLGSVGNSAVEIARRITRGNIICAGLDFSFTADKYHARGTPGHRGKLNAQTRLRGLFNVSAFDGASFAAASKTGVPVRSSPVMQNYRALFEQEFGGDSRLFDIEGSGLSLGIKTLSMKEAFEKISRREEESEKNLTQGRKGAKDAEKRERIKEKVLVFLEGEKKRLEDLRGILTGEAEAEAAVQERLNALVDECDYLWAHFPDYSGGRRPPLGENSPYALSFLKRVRAEIDPMLKLLERVICA